MTDLPYYSSGTRAVKTARYLQEVAPDLLPDVESSEGFGSILTPTVLATLHRDQTEWLPLVTNDAAATQWPP